jgi:malonyl-CoA decarboxylase
MSARAILGRIVDSLGPGAIARAAAQRSAERLAQLLRTLASQRGEASGAVLARRAVGLYKRLDPAARGHFFEVLARDFSPDREAVLQAAIAYHRDPSGAHLSRLQRVAEPPRQEIFRRMNMAPAGTATLLALRRELLQAMRTNPALVVVDQDLEHLLSSWFNRGFLELRRIDWNTPASILEKLIAYEAVHQIHGFPDLKRRLERDRRCFAFFHPALPDEPLIFVEVALVDEMPADVAPILAPESVVGEPRRARCAVFYSITSCQPGLRGVSFGNFLIKQVASDLHAELPNLKVFATLSPVPGLRAWAEKRAAHVPRVAEAGTPGDYDRETLESLAAWYLTREWEGAHACDPVARFHLGNGARLERINWRADVSTKGLAQSFGMMVNYVYDLAMVERNHEEYVNRHRVVCSSAVDKQARAAEPLLGVRPQDASPPRT